MTTILNPQGCAALARAIAGEDGFGGGFLDADDFAAFVNELNDNFKALVPADKPFGSQVLRYVASKNVRGDIGELLDLLSDRWSGRRDDLFAIVKELVDFINSGKAGRSWFLSYASFDQKQFEDLERRNVFGFFRETLRKPSEKNLHGRLSDVLRDDLNRSSFFVALVGQYYKDSKNTSDVFETAFVNWQSRLSGDPSVQQRLIVLCLDAEGKHWWDTNYEKRIPAEGKLLVKAFDAAEATLKAELEDWLNQKPLEPIDQTPAQPVAAKSILVLGQPEGVASGATTAAVNTLVSYLKGRAPDLVDYWQDGWSKKELQPQELNERTALFAKIPLFIRAIYDRDATIREVQAELKPHLLQAFGFPFSESIWLSEFGKLRRIYWRPDGPAWSGDGSEQGWIGQAQDFGTRLAELAGFPNKPNRKAIVRYEDPRSDNETRTQLNRKLVVTSLQSAATQTGAGVLPNTVPISFEKIEDSIKKFTRNGLNVIALHDLEVRPLDMEDTIRRFEGADKRIDNAVNSLFGDAGHAPILRVAILLKNATLFDGLTFDQGSSVRRWNLLKCPSNADGQPSYDQQDFQHIANEARDMLAHAAGG